MSCCFTFVECRSRFVLLVVLAFCPANSLTAALIAAFGDSNTQGSADSYPGLLNTLLADRHGVGRFTVVNHGISGLTTAGLVNNLRQKPWLNQNPDVAIIMIGENDLWPLVSNPSLFETTILNAAANVQTAVSLIRDHNYSNGKIPKIIVAVIPEPSTVPLVAVSLVTLVYYRKRDA